MLATSQERDHGLAPRGRPGTMRGMTTRRGMLWKTPWKRDRNKAPLPPGGEMAFFQNFDSGANSSAYKSVGNTMLGQSLPFWFGAVSAQQNTLTNFFGAVPGAGFGFSAGLLGGTAGLVSGNAEAAPSLVSNGQLAVRPAAGTIAVVAILAIVEQAGAGYRLTTYFCRLGQPIKQTVTPYAPPGATQLVLSASTGLIHGAAGGAGVPTAAQVQSWFQQLKLNREVGEIPGLTSHLYSATSVYPLVPAVLPNGAGGQNMDYTVIAGAPTPTNVLLAVSFPW